MQEETPRELNTSMVYPDGSGVNRGCLDTERGLEEMVRVGRKRRSTRRRRARAQSRRRSRFVRSVIIAVPLLIASVIATTSLLSMRAVASVQQSVPSLEAQGSINLAQTTEISASDGTLLAYLHDEQNRTVIKGDKIPDILRHAVVAIEDERFYEHNGVDIEGIFRAAATNLQSQGISQGFSTITMQLVGNLYLNRREMTLGRKFNEIMLALQLERKYSKNEILNMYLNTVYFGSTAYGIEAASRTYFNKEPAQLTIAEAALLAGLPQRPNGYSPRRHADLAIKRRDVVLGKMQELGYISVSEYQAAISEPLTLAPYSPYVAVQEPYVVAYVRKKLIDMYGEERVFKGGLRVETTINPAFQKLAQQAIAGTLNRKNDPSAALVSIEPNTGQIVAMVGGNDYDTSKFNLASQGRRQPGSAFKPFVLVTAIEMGIDPWNTYYNSAHVKLTYPGAPKPWDVQTYGGDYHGPSTIFDATLRSDNTVYAQLALDVGIPRVIDVAHRMGITSELNADPAISLGGLKYGVSPLEMASAYATLANGGVYVEPTIIKRILDSDGNVIWEAAPKTNQALSPGVAYDATRVLIANVQSGTGTRAAIGRPAAGKTGTTTDWTDAWFVGYTPHLSTAVWMGDPDAQVPMKNVHGISVTGGSFPAIMWREFMYTADRTYPYKQFAVPKVWAKYDRFFVSTYGTAPTSTSLPSTTTTLTPPPTSSTTTTATSTTTTSTTAPPGP
jgi:penicillin-binding protein 1A